MDKIMLKVKQKIKEKSEELSKKINAPNLLTNLIRNRLKTVLLVFFSIILVFFIIGNVSSHNNTNLKKTVAHQEKMKKELLGKSQSDVRNFLEETKFTETFINDDSEENQKIVSVEFEGNVCQITLADSQKQVKEKQEIEVKEKKAKQEAENRKNTTPEKVLALMNKMELKNGETFNFTATLAEERLWGVGHSWKNYNVYVKTGKATMMLQLKDEKEGMAEQWKNGTKVKFSVKVEKYDGKEKGDTFLLVVQSGKIISGKTSRKAKEAAKIKKVDDTLKEYAKDLNDSSGFEAILGIERNEADVICVHLSSLFASDSSLEIKSVVTELNKQLVRISGIKGPFRYDISGLVIGENRMIMDPEKVKFKNLD